MSPLVTVSQVLTVVEVERVSDRVVVNMVGTPGVTPPLFSVSGSSIISDRSL